MTFDITNGAFRLDGEEVFLNSGEIQYYRIRKELWDEHLTAAKEAGLMAVATYIPWDWHEPQQGTLGELTVQKGEVCVSESITHSPSCTVFVWDSRDHGAEEECVSLSIRTSIVKDHTDNVAATGSDCQPFPSCTVLSLLAPPSGALTGRWAGFTVQGRSV